MEVKQVANIKSAQKRVLVTAKKNAINKDAKSAMKTSIKKAFAAADNKAADTETLVRAAVSSVDTGVKKGIIHKNTAARRKSALMKKANAAKA